MRNCRVVVGGKAPGEQCYGAENAALGGFFRFMEKRHKTKRHINAILSAGIDTTFALEKQLDSIGLLRGLGEKSAKEVIDGYLDYREASMTPEQKKQKEVQTWNLTRVAQETPYEVGEKVFFFCGHCDRERSSVPELRQGTVRAVKMYFGYENSERKEIGQKRYDFHIYVWNAAANALMQLESKSIFRTKREALASIKVAE